MDFLDDGLGNPPPGAYVHHPAGNLGVQPHALVPVVDPNQGVPAWMLENNRSTCWWDPIVGIQTTETLFKLKSIFRDPNNYVRQLARVHLQLLDDDPQIVIDQIHNTEGDARDVVYCLLARKQEFRHHYEWCNFLAPAHCRNIFLDLGIDNHLVKIDQFRVWAKRQLEFKRNCTQTRSEYREKHLYLSRLLGFQLTMRLAEQVDDFDRLQHTSAHFGIPMGSQSNVYSISHDYSDVRKSKKWGANIFWCDAIMGQPARDEVNFFPLPMMRAEDSPLYSTAVSYTATIGSGLAHLTALELAFGEKTLRRMHRPIVETFETIDIQCWNTDILDPHLDNIVRTEINIIGDQASSEMRFSEGTLCHFPGMRRMPLGHRLSNNVSDANEQVSASAAGYRRFLNGPKGTRVNQGLLRLSQRELAAEYERDPELSVPRKWYVEMVGSSKDGTFLGGLGSSMQLLHGTTMRWFRPLEHARMLKDWKHGLLYSLEPLADKETAQRIGRPAAQNNPVRNINVRAPIDPEDVLETDEEDLQARKSLPVHFKGYASEMRQKLLDVSHTDIDDTILLSQSHYDVFCLLEELNSCNHTSYIFGRPHVLKNYKKYIDPTVTALDGPRSVPEIQAALSMYRPRMWRNILYGVIDAIRASRSCLVPGLKIMRNVVNCYYADCWDPEFGLWETIIHSPHDFFVEEDLRTFGREPPAPLTIYAKRAIRCLLEGGDKREWLAKAVERSVTSVPLYEKESETQWRDAVNYKCRASPDQSLFSKQCQRLQQLDRHPRYQILPQIGRFDNLLPLSGEDVMRGEELDPELWQPLSSEEENQQVLKDILQDQIASAGGKERYMTQKFTSLKEALFQKKQLFRNNLLPQYQMDCLNYLGDASAYTSTPGNVLGFRGVEAKIALENGYGHALQNHYRKMGVWFSEIKLIAHKLKNNGFQVGRCRKKSCAVMILANVSGKSFGLGAESCLAQPSHYLWPTNGDEVDFCEGGFEFMDYLDSEAMIGRIANTSNLEIKIGLNPVWITAEEIQLMYFPFAPRHVQLLLLAKTFSDNTALTADMLNDAPLPCLHQLYHHQLYKEAVPDVVIAELVHRFENADIISVQEAMAEEIAIRKAVEATKLTKLENPSFPRENPDAHFQGGEHDEGLKRFRPGVIVTFKLFGDKVAEARSFRRGQGLKADLLRMQYTGDYRPSKTPFSTTVDCDAQVDHQIESILIPRLAIEFGAEVDDFTYQRQGGFVSVLDEWGLMNTWTEKEKNPFPEKKPASKIDYMKTKTRKERAQEIGKAAGIGKYSMKKRNSLTKKGGDDKSGKKDKKGE